jgi:hypothetical protein
VLSLAPMDWQSLPSCSFMSRSTWSAMLFLGGEVLSTLSVADVAKNIFSNLEFRNHYLPRHHTKVAERRPCRIIFYQILSSGTICVPRHRTQRWHQR